MKDILDPAVKVQYLVRVHTELGDFTDALYFTGDQWDKATQEDINKTAQDRANAWVENVKHPPAPIEPSIEDLREEEKYLQERLSVCSAKIAAKG